MWKQVMGAAMVFTPSFAQAGVLPASPGHSPDRAMIREARVDCFDQHTGEFLHPGACRGESRYTPGYGGHTGYRLYFDGRKVSGPDAPGYTRRQAEENCAWNVRTKPGISIRCTYNGVTFFEN
jgi:hypothetical protein